MDLFHKIEGGIAITRSKGILKQVDVYRRGETVFIKHAGGFVRICAKLPDDTFGTVVPDMFVLEFEAEGVVAGDYRGPRYIAPLKAAA